MLAIALKCGRFGGNADQGILLRVDCGQKIWRLTLGSDAILGFNIRQFFLDSDPRVFFAVLFFKAVNMVAFVQSQVNVIVTFQQALLFEAVYLKRKNFAV